MRVQSDDDLEREGSALIRAAGGFGKGQGVYSDRQMRRLTEAHEAPIEDVYASGRDLQSVDDKVKRAILDAVWPDLCSALPWREIYVLEKTREGWTQTEMADGASVDPRTIRAWKVQAFKHLRQSADPYWSRWLIEVLIDVFTKPYLIRVGRL